MMTQASEERHAPDLGAARPPIGMNDLDFDYHCFLRTLDAEPAEAPALRDVATAVRDLLRGPIWLVIMVAGALITVGLGLVL